MGVITANRQWQTFSLNSQQYSDISASLQDVTKPGPASLMLASMGVLS
jgi:hypothetical protein